jgi:hypothetical protein
MVILSKKIACEKEKRKKELVLFIYCCILIKSLSNTFCLHKTVRFSSRIVNLKRRKKNKIKKLVLFIYFVVLHKTVRFSKRFSRINQATKKHAGHRETNRNKQSKHHISRGSW